MRSFWTLLRMELRRLSRTSQVYAYVILPALLMLPTAVFLGFAAASLRQAPRVAVPLDLPLALALTAALDEAGLEVVEVDDPAAAWLAGDAQAAVLAVEAGDGLAGANTSLERAERATWVVHVVADDTELEVSLTTAVDQAGDRMLADLVAVSGGVVEADLWVAGIATLPLPAEEPFSIRRAAYAYAVFTVSLVGFFFASLSGVADRNEGVTETLLAAPVRAQTLLAARLTAVLALQVLACLLMAANVILLLSNTGDLLQEAQLTPAMVVSLLGGAALCDAFYLLVGTWSPNAKSANNIGGAVMMGLLALLGVGVVAEVPIWLPLAGITSAETPAEHIVAGLSSLVAAAIVVAAGGARLERTVALKLSTESR